MNKLLLSTTALVASASFAMADVDLSGSAEMGVIGGEDIETQFHTDIDVNFSMSGETDGGLTFGASIDLDEVDDGNLGGQPDFDENTNSGGETIFISGNFGTLTMGDTDGALDWAMTEAIIGSAIADDHEHAGYNGNSGFDGTYDNGRSADQVARYDYSFGDFAVALSAEVADFDDDDEGDDEDDFFDNDPVLGVGFTYSGEFAGISFGAGLGYQQVDDSSIVGVSLDMKMDNGLQAIFNYSDYDDTLGGLALGELEDHIGLAVGYETGALLVAINYGKFDYEDGDADGIGLIANYDLGGGASLQAGYGYSDIDADDIDEDDGDFDTYSLGLAFTF